ncbi:MAG TPA: hypothetical protein VGY77_12320 [Gemmataceae bacterium]|nr:hypothetical protein [Gemmataceae bacterium]
MRMQKAWIGMAAVGILVNTPMVLGSEFAKLSGVETETAAETPAPGSYEEMITPPLVAHSYAAKLGQYSCSSHKVWSWLTYSSSRPKLCNCCYQSTCCCTPPLYAFFPCPEGTACCDKTDHGWNFSLPKLSCPNFLKFPWRKAAEEEDDPEPIVQAAHKTKSKGKK